MLHRRHDDVCSFYRDFGRSNRPSRGGSLHNANVILEDTMLFIGIILIIFSRSAVEVRKNETTNSMRWASSINYRLYVSHSSGHYLCCLCNLKGVSQKILSWMRWLHHGRFAEIVLVVQLALCFDLQEERHHIHNTNA